MPAGYVERVLAAESFASQQLFEDVCGCTPIAEESVATAAPRRGIMPI